MPPQVLRLLTEGFAALARLHAAGVLHQDLKLENVHAVCVPESAPQPFTGTMV